MELRDNLKKLMSKVKNKKLLAEAISDRLGMCETSARTHYIDRVSVKNERKLAIVIDLTQKHIYNEQLPGA